MRSGFDVPRRFAIAALSCACLALVPACGSSTNSAASDSGTPSSNTGAAGTPAPSVSTSPAPAVAHPPTSCGEIPESLINSYIGGIAKTVSLGPPPNGVSCEFVNANASSIVILDIGAGGTTASFAALRAGSGQGGRTVTSISGLGSSAFSISQNGVTSGVDVLTAQGLVFSVAAHLTLDQDETLIEQLMQRY